MTQNKKQKRLARRLAAVRGYSYCAALNELRGLPPDARWDTYVERVEAVGNIVPEEQREK